jgi:hypothetical protein
MFFGTCSVVGFLDKSIIIGIPYFFLKKEILLAPKSKAISQFNKFEPRDFLPNEGQWQGKCFWAVRGSQLLKPKMNALKYFLAILALSGALAISARAGTDIPSVPDSGGTVMLLGAALAGLALLGRYRKR